MWSRWGRRMWQRGAGDWEGRLKQKKAHFMCCLGGWRGCPLVKNVVGTELGQKDTIKNSGRACAHCTKGLCLVCHFRKWGFGSAIPPEAQKLQSHHAQLLM